VGVDIFGKFLKTDQVSNHSSRRQPLPFPKYRHDRGRLQGTVGDSIDGEKRRGIKVLRRKSSAISRLVDGYGSGSTPAASTKPV